MSVWQKILAFILAPLLNFVWGKVKEELEEKKAHEQIEKEREDLQKELDAADTPEKLKAVTEKIIHRLR